MYCTKSLADVGKNFFSISFLTFGTHMPVYSSLFDNLLFFGRNVVYTAVCVNTHVLNLAFSLLGMYFPLSFY